MCFFGFTKKFFASPLPPEEERITLLNQIKLIEPLKSFVARIEKCKLDGLTFPPDVESIFLRENSMVLDFVKRESYIREQYRLICDAKAVGSVFAIESEATIRVFEEERNKHLSLLQDTVEIN